MSETQPTEFRTAKLVLVTPDGNLVGSLPPVRVSTPWWSHAEPVVEAVHKQFNLSVTILRLLDAQEGSPYDDGGEVIYLAEIEKPVMADPWNGSLPDHPLRLPYAKTGGPKIELDWALSVLKDRNITPVAPPVQIRTWNLSSIWRIPTGDGNVWLKSVPPFFAHEGRIMNAMQEFPIPQLIANKDGRVLLKEIPGEDMYGAEETDLRRMITTLVNIQSHWNGRVDDLLALGLPDWRGASLTAMIRNVVHRTSSELNDDELKTLHDFIDHLPQRFAEVAACGMEDTLVHGDFHAGNVRANADRLTILDWGDSGIGHPMLDQAAFMERFGDSARQSLKDHWNTQWLKRNPSCRPARAAELLAPIACARQAVIYQHFMDNIEPAEHVYHRTDPARWLHRTTLLLQ